MSCLAALSRTIGRRSTETPSESLKSPDEETLSASVTRKHGSSWGANSSGPGQPAARGLGARVSPCHAVFSLKPEGRFIISVIFRTDSSAHLCPNHSAEVQEFKPPPWPQERFRGEAPSREPLQPDTLARMELTGKKTLGTSSRRAWPGRRWGRCRMSKGLGNPISQERVFAWTAADTCISSLAPKWESESPPPKNDFLFVDPSTSLRRSAPGGHASPYCETNSVQPSSSCLRPKTPQQTAP